MSKQPGHQYDRDVYTDLRGIIRWRATGTAIEPVIEAQLKLIEAVIEAQLKLDVANAIGSNSSEQGSKGSAESFNRQAAKVRNRPPGWSDHPSDIKRAQPIEDTAPHYEHGYRQAITDVCKLLAPNWPHVRNEVEAMLRRRNEEGSADE